MKNKKIIIISGSLIILFLFTWFGVNHLLKEDENSIQITLEESIQNHIIGDEQIDLLNQYLLDKQPDSEYYFIKGYLAYDEGDYKNAIKNFNLASDHIKDSTSIFIKIYTYILLNESLKMDDQYESLVDNCEIALNYISGDKAYKNDINLVWRAISVLVDNENTIEKGISILNSYLQTTKRLTNESQVRIIANIGQLYTLIYKYSDAMYNYLDAIHILDSNPLTPNGSYYKVKLLTTIGDINYSLNEYENAINYYKDALKIPLNNEQQEALIKSVTIVNLGQAYIELGLYDLATNQTNELNNLLPHLDKDVKDDIEILMNNLLALANIYQHQFIEAEKQLTQAVELLNHDKVEYSLNKDSFIALTYAQLYKEKRLYDEALQAYDYVLAASKSKGLGLEEQVYYQISEMYKEQQDLNNYVKYNELYIKQKSDNTKVFKEDYMEYTAHLYESDQLREKMNRHKINYLIMSFSLVGLSVFILIKIRTVKKLRHLSFTDSMTGLYNRKYLDYYMDKNKKKLIENQLSVIIIDIDYFKKYNDNYGHIEGDKIIKEVANTLKESIRKDDIVIRYGGEEMVIILPNAVSSEAESLAQKIQTNLKNKNIEHKYSEVSSRLTMSIGVYTTQFANQDIYALIKKADIALYTAKKSGRNRYEIISD